jgi:hypothetical protein
MSVQAVFPLKAGLSGTAWPVRSRRMIDAIGMLPVRRGRCRGWSSRPLTWCNRKYRFVFDPSNDDMMQGAGGIYANAAKLIE